MASRLESIALRTSSLELPSPSPALRHAIRLGAASAGALWLTYVADFPNSTWPLITVLMVAQPTSGAALQKGILRIIGTVCSAFAAIAIYGLFAQDHLLLAASICVVYAISVYGMTAPRNAYAWNVFGFTTGIILGDVGPGTQIEDLAFDRATLVMIGLLASFAAEAIFWPVRTEDELRASLTARARQVRDAFHSARSRLLTTGSPSDPDPAIAPSTLIAQLGLIDQLRNEMGVTKARVRRFAHVALGLDSLEASLRTLAASTQVQIALLPPRLRSSLESLLDRSVESLTETGLALSEAREPERSSAALHAELLRFDQARLDELAALIDPASDAEAPSARATAFVSSLAPVLQGMVDLQTEIEAALVAIAREDAGEASEAAAERAAGPLTAPARRLGLDPLRLELALRSGIAVGSVFVVMPLLRWPVSSTPMTLAYLTAQLPTRAAMTGMALGFVAVGVVSWIVSDLSIMYVAPHLGRMPQALVYPLVIAGTAGYASVRFPKLAPIAPSTAMIIVLSVMGGVHAPADVEGPYKTTVIILTGVLIGLVAGRLLWPRTAAELFLEHAARQLELCRPLLRGPASPAASKGRRRAVAQATIGYTQQLTQLAQLHEQARAEAVVRALDDERRTRLLTACAELVEAGLQARSLEAGGFADRPAFDLPALAPLRKAMARQDEAIEASLDAMIRALRGEVDWRPSDLGAAQRRVEARIAELRGMHELAATLGARGADALLSRIDEKRRLASRAMAVEAWLQAWTQARAATAAEAQA